MSEDGIAIKPTSTPLKQTNKHTRSICIYTLYTNICAQTHNHMTIH